MPAQRWWLIAALVLAPLAVFPGVGLMQAKNVGFLLLGLAFVVWMVPSVWLQAFAGWALLSFVVAGMPLWGLAGLLGVLAWLLVYGEAARLTEPWWRRVRLAVTVAALFQVAWMLLQAAKLDPVFRPLDYLGKPLPGPAPVVGWFANPSDTALYLGLSLPFLPWWASLVVGSAVLFWLTSTAGLVCVTLAWAFLAWRWLEGHPPVVRWPALAALGVGWLLLASVWVTLVDPQGAGSRPAIWAQAGMLAMARPIFGWGPNAVGYRLQMIHSGTNERWDFVFNEWLQGAVEVGLVGAGLAGLALGTLLWRARRGAPPEFWPLATIALAVSLFSIPLRVGPAAMLIALAFGYANREEVVA